VVPRSRGRLALSPSGGHLEQQGVRRPARAPPLQSRPPLRPASPTRPTWPLARRCENVAA
jgi:hypothetical protein